MNEEILKNDNKEKSIKPQIYTISNTKLINELTKDFMNKGKQIIETNPKKKKKAEIYANLIFNEEDINLPKNFTSYDREILNAVCSLFEVGNTFIWAEQIYRTMTGQTKTERVSKKSIKNVVTSLEKMRRSIITIEFEQQAKLYKHQNIKEFKISDNILHMKGYSALINGTKIIGYKILEKPILYRYSQQIGQIISIPIKLLNTKKAVSNTNDNIVLRAYMIRRIELIKYSKVTNKISYKKAFKECQIKNDDRTTKMRKITSIKKILNLWIEEKYIKSYKEYKDNNTNAGIEINI